MFEIFHVSFIKHFRPCDDILIVLISAVDVMVISIIGIHNATKTVYGVGNNMMSYMKYIPNKAKWYSISQDQWKKAKSTLSDHEVVKIEDGDDDLAEPATDKQKNIGNGEKWGGR